MRLFHWFAAQLAKLIKPTRLLPFEPDSDDPFRRRLGFIDRRPDDEPRTKFGNEMIRAQREALFERIAETTNGAHADERIKLQLHGNAMEYRARWDGRRWAPPPPMIDRAESWVFGVKPAEGFEENRIASGMKDG